MVQSKEERAAVKKLYKENNKEKIRLRRLVYLAENKEKIKLKRQTYNEENKEHISKWGKEYRHKNKDKILIVKRKYRHKNKEKYTTYAREYARTEKAQTTRRKHYDMNKPDHIYKRHCNRLKLTLGITPLQYEEMIKSQNNCCAICGKTNIENKKRLAVDHCHKTGNVRALLCSLCNKTLGGFKDDITLLNKAIEYLKKHNTPQEINQAEYMI
jgi:hypothetical protein